MTGAGGLTPPAPGHLAGEANRERRIETMKGTTLLITSTAVTALNLSGQAAAQTDERPVSFEIGTGVEYDSNVALLELDTATNSGDAIALFDFAVAYDMRSNSAFDLKAGYNFSETAHDDFDDFDLRIHRGSGTMSYDFGRVDVGSVFQHALAELDGDDFMTLTQVSPYFSTLIGERFFLRVAYTRTDKDFDDNPGRAAQADAVSSDLYYFVNGLRTYILIGFRYDDEDANDGQFDYSGNRLRVQLSRRFTLDSRELTFKVGLRSEQRDYDNETLSIGAARRDDRLQLEASGEIPLNDRFTAGIAYKRANNESNLPAVDFDEDVLSVTFKAGF